MCNINCCKRQQLDLVRTLYGRIRAFWATKIRLLLFTNGIIEEKKMKFLNDCALAA